MAKVAEAIEEDKKSLEQLMNRLGVRNRIGRQLGAKLGELAMRVKLNGRLIGYSPLSRVLELEAMIMGVTGKLQLWRSMLAVEGSESPLERSEIERLHDRAEDQRRRLEELHRRAAGMAFSGKRR